MDGPGFVTVTPVYGDTLTYSISHKKVKEPYRTRTAPVPHPYSTLSELRAYFERTTNRAAHAQFGSVQYASIQCGAVRYGAVRWL